MLAWSLGGRDKPWAGVIEIVFSKRLLGYAIQEN